MPTHKNEGWAPCMFSPKHHYFIKGESLCRRYAIYATRLTHFCANDDGSTQNCGTCRIKLIPAPLRKQAAEKPVVHAFAHVRRRVYP